MNGKPVGFEATTDADGQLPASSTCRPATGRCWSSRPATTRSARRRPCARRGASTSPITSSAASTTRSTSRSPRRARARRSAAPSSRPRRSTRSRARPAIRWRVVQNFAGVGRAPSASRACIIVRGSAPEDTQHLRRRLEVPLIYHFGGLRSVIPVGILDSIEFYPGQLLAACTAAPPAASSTSRSSGCSPRRSAATPTSASSTPAFTWRSRSATRAASRSPARRSYIDVLLNAAVPDDAAVSLVTAPRYYDYQLLANYRPAPAHDIRVFVVRVRRSAGAAVRQPGRPGHRARRPTALSATTTFYRAIGVATATSPATKLENNLRVSWGAGLAELQRRPAALRLRRCYTRSCATTVRYKFVGQVDAASRASTRCSASTDIFVRLPLPPKEGEPPPDVRPERDASPTKSTTRCASRRRRSSRPSGSRSPRWLLLPGLRVDYFARIHQTVPQPRLTARWQFTEQVHGQGRAWACSPRSRLRRDRRAASATRT